MGNVSDRSQEQTGNPLTDRSGNADERGERIEELIQQTINKYQAFRNIHIQQGNNEKTLIKYKQSFLSEKNKNFDLGPSQGQKENFRMRKATAPKFESKYLDSGTEIIQELSEEQKESSIDRQELDTGSFMNELGNLSGRERANTKTDEEWNNLLKKVYGNDRNNTILTFSGSFGEQSKNSEDLTAKQQGELLLLEYQLKYSQEIFEKGILNCFETIFEAGYLFKYLQQVWMSDHSDKELTQDNHSENQSYKQRKQSFKLTSKHGTGGSGYNPYATDGENGEKKKTGCCN